MDIFTYMDKNGFAVVAIACFMCITLGVGFVQLGEALKVLFSRINAGKETPVEKESE